MCAWEGAARQVVSALPAPGSAASVAGSRQCGRFNGAGAGLRSQLSRPLPPASRDAQVPPPQAPGCSPRPGPHQALGAPPAHFRAPPRRKHSPRPAQPGAVRRRHGPHGGGAGIQGSISTDAPVPTCAPGERPTPTPPAGARRSTLLPSEKSRDGSEILLGLGKERVKVRLEPPRFPAEALVFSALFPKKSWHSGRPLSVVLTRSPHLDPGP